VEWVDPHSLDIIEIEDALKKLNKKRQNKIMIECGVN
jgi:hypothetical protein